MKRTGWMTLILILVCAVLAFGADTYTPNYHFRLPDLDIEDEDTPWGEKYNTNWLLADAAIADPAATSLVLIDIAALKLSTGALQVEVDKRVLRAGDTMTGQLTIQSSETVTGAVGAAYYQISTYTVLALIGTNSVAVGPEAGAHNITGEDLVFTGAGAGYSNTTGNYLTFMGAGAGYYNTTGWDGSFFGVGAGHHNTIAENNAYFGGGAGYYNSIGSENSCFGTDSCGWNSGGIGYFSSSTVMGFAAGNKLTTAANGNTLYGFKAGYEITTGTGNIVIGYKTDTTAPGANNELHIGELIVGDMAVGTVTVKGDFTATYYHGDGSAMVGISSPTSAMAISSGIINADLQAYKLTVQASTAALAVSTGAIDADLQAYKLTVQASTTALAVSTGTFVKRSGDIMEGSLNLNGYSISGAHYSGYGAQLSQGILLYTTDAWINSASSITAVNFFGDASAMVGISSPTSAMAISTEPLKDYANWNTAYGWGDHPIKSTAAIVASTGVIQASLDAVISSTGEVYAALQTTYTALVAQDSAMLATLSTAAYLANNQIFTGINTFSSSMTVLGASLLQSTITTTGTIEGPNSILFNVNNTATIEEGRLAWDDDWGALMVGMKGSTINLPLGKTNAIRARNTSGSDIAVGKIVYVSSASGSIQTIALAEADSAIIRHKFVIGMTAEAIANNGLGHVVTFGEVHDIPVPTATYSDGDDLYLSATAGEFTNVISPAFEKSVPIGSVLLAHNTAGKVFIQPVNIPDHVVASSVTADEYFGSSMTLTGSLSADSFSIGDISVSSVCANATTCQATCSSGTLFYGQCTTIPRCANKEGNRSSDTEFICTTGHKVEITVKINCANF